jgi:hypothetical protein
MMENQKIIHEASSPENKRLNVFVGKWHTTGEVAATKPAVKIDVFDTYEWLPGGYALIHYADGTVGDERLHSTEIIGYDPSRKMYFAPFFDAQGGAGWEEIRVKDSTWTWRGKDVMGTKYHRCIAVFSNDGNTINARHDKSEDGENWELWMNVTLAKVSV